jgi:glucokinase
MAKIIGLDIGGTKITGIIYKDGRIIDSLTIVTPKNLHQFEKSLLKLVDFLSAKGKPAAIGIGIAGLVDSKKGIAVYSPNMGFIKNLNLVKFFQVNGYKNIKADNDANCFTRAELILGQGKTLNNFLALTLGTGIGGGIVIDRRLYRGHDNMGGELGHMLYQADFLEKQFQAARDKKNNRQLGAMFGSVFASLVNIFAPQAIILGGGVATDKTRNFLPLAGKEMKKYLFNKNSKTKILVSKLKNAGALGAALLWK